MKSVWLVCMLVLGCQRGETSTSQTAASGGPVATGPAYAQDIDSLCNAMTLSGADKLDSDARQLTIANFLGTTLKTAEAHQFLVQTQPLVGEAKATAYEAEAHRVGLSGCALAAQWRTPAPH